MSRPAHAPSIRTTSSAVERELAALLADAPRVEKLGVAAAYRVSSAVEGPKAVIFGSIHGDEPAGSLAIKELLKQFATEDLRARLERRVTKVDRNL